MAFLYYKLRYFFYKIKYFQKLICSNFEDWNTSVFDCPQQPNVIPFWCPLPSNFNQFPCAWQPNFTPFQCLQQLSIKVHSSGPAGRLFGLTSRCQRHQNSMAFCFWGHWDKVKNKKRHFLYLIFILHNI